MENQSDDLIKNDSGQPAADPDGGVTFILTNIRLLIVFAALILICASFFMCGFLTGRRANTEGVQSNASPMPERKSAPKEFLDPKCGIPFSPHFNDPSSYLTDVDEDRPKPTDAQMVQIRRLLPKDTRIHDLSRIDADPPLAFVLHQPEPRRSSDVELTVFRFKKDRVESENLGAYCFIPDFLIDREGRAIGGWSENPTGGNAWSCSSMETMVIEKGEVTNPEIELSPCQVAKDLILDQGAAVLIVWDTRFEYFEGLCRACSPIQQSIFELNRDGVWVDGTSRHRRLVEEWIRDDIEMLEEAKANGNEDEIGRTALDLYLDAETAGQMARYGNTVKRALREIGWVHFIEMIDKAKRRNSRLVDLSGSCSGSDEIEVDPHRIAGAVRQQSPQATNYHE